MVGKVSPWVAPDAADAALRLDSEAALQQELAWAAHLSLQAVMLPVLSPTEGNANYARLVGQAGTLEPSTCMCHDAGTAALDIPAAALPVACMQLGDLDQPRLWSVMLNVECCLSRSSSRG